MKKKNYAIFEIVCYVVAALLGVVALYMTYENIAYINEYAAAYGATFADLGGQAIQSVVSAFVPYFTYAFVVFGIGKIYHLVNVKCDCECVDSCEEGCCEDACCEEVSCECCEEAEAAETPVEEAVVEEAPVAEAAEEAEAAEPVPDAPEKEEN